MRVLHILWIIGKYSVLYLLISLHVKNTPKHRLLRKFFEDTGGSFIKFGQLLAMRVDVLPNEYTLELLELLDNVKPFPYHQVQEIFIRELGSPPEKVFKDFQKKPFASASFSQVHGAKLPDGTIVAVKILRPGIEDQVKADYIIIKFLAFVGDMIYKIDALPWKEFAQEFEKWTSQELDYHIEAENTETMRLNLLNDPTVVIPKMYFRFSTKRILVEQYIEGVHLARVLRGLKNGRLKPEQLTEMGISLSKIPQLLITTILKQYFLYGRYHADPHPGNILLLPKNRIALIDFGIMGNEIPGNKTSFIKMIKYDIDLKFKEASYYAADFAGDELKQMIASTFPAHIHHDEVNQFMKVLTDHFSQKVEEMFQKSVSDINSLKKDSATLLLEVLKEANKYRIKIPQEAVAFLRTLSIFGLMAKQLNHSFLISAGIKNFFSEYESSIPIQEETIPLSYKRIGRERAMEKLQNWMSYLIEKDPVVFDLVNNYIKRYNLTEP